MKYIVLKQRTSTFLTSHRHTMVGRKDEIPELLQISGIKNLLFPFDFPDTQKHNWSKVHFPQFCIVQLYDLTTEIKVDVLGFKPYLPVPLDTLCSLHIFCTCILHYME